MTTGSEHRPSQGSPVFITVTQSPVARVLCQIGSSVSDDRDEHAGRTSQKAVRSRLSPLETRTDFGKVNQA